MAAIAKMVCSEVRRTAWPPGTATKNVAILMPAPRGKDDGLPPIVVGIIQVIVNDAEALAGFTPGSAYTVTVATAN